jgi:hypothetical protein
MLKMSGFIKTTNNANAYATVSDTTSILLSSNEWTNAQTFDTSVTCGGLVTASNGLTVNGVITIPSSSIPITAVNGLTSALALLDPIVTVNASIASAIVPYSTSTQMNTAIASAIVPYSTSTQMNTAIASAIVPYSTTTQMHTAITSAIVPYSTTTQMNTSINTALTTGTNISTTGTITSTGLLTVGAMQSNSIYYENTQVITGVVNAYTLSYSAGGIFYIPSSIAITALSTLVITNIPISTTQSFTFTVGYYQASTRNYINSLRVSDTTGTTYLLGTSSTFATPLYNGGLPALTGTTPCLILQQFTVFSIGTARYVGTSISSFQ